MMIKMKQLKEMLNTQQKLVEEHLEISSLIVLMNFIPKSKDWRSANIQMELTTMIRRICRGVLGSSTSPKLRKIQHSIEGCNTRPSTFITTYSRKWIQIRTNHSIELRVLVKNGIIQDTQVYIMNVTSLEGKNIYHAQTARQTDLFL